ncbi:MAG: hypothetical protein MK135_13075, partial [Polyangiaceae bacterium]|nr:hypothetical protein [Polyangiaceae bacterium]
VISATPAAIGPRGNEGSWDVSAVKGASADLECSSGKLTFETPRTRLIVAPPIVETRVEIEVDSKHAGLSFETPGPRNGDDVLISVTSCNSCEEALAEECSYAQQWFQGTSTLMTLQRNNVAAGDHTESLTIPMTAF